MVERNPINQDGKMLFFASTGMISYWISVLQSNLKVLQISYSQSIASIIIIILTLLSYYGTYGFFSAYFATTDVYNTLSHQLKSPIYYLTVFVVICLTFGIDYLFYQVSERKKQVKIAQNLKQRENTGINNNSVNSLSNEQEIEMTEKI
ncbi:hypothetical protein PPERSA_04853 [Pseudocohnilembus persalinus]|uniref:P-type ATPase C-terminal domain-containing protein n=1 Tax=Pseudocohnilembus persalinus TaxID=266149 RepID=A0A0V0QJ55_PSEPJ|nr:hypothetical protein PPERSA_04853 [Pseudocohnilembus persalinus]|eukprot:KRX02231.1 hypothetical protein PPERSA_04853 [Pseudocohnilembus persalinus]